jgi:hypothetical protein
VKKSRLFLALSCTFGLSSIGLLNLQKPSNPDLRDTALLALIKNDLTGLESFIKNGGNLDSLLPELDGKNLTVAEGIAHFERVKFAHYLRTKKYPFTKQRPYGTDDVLRIAVRKNNPELLKEFMDHEVDLNLTYKDKGKTLLHIASESCSHKLLPLFKEMKQDRWDQKALDGSTPLTIAAERECLPMLSYWRENRADFETKDGRGKSAYSILRESKSPFLASLVSLFQDKTNSPVKGVQIAKAPQFYKKRIIPKDQIIDHSALLEPEDRPLEAIQTAEYSEFSD